MVDTLVAGTPGEPLYYEYYHYQDVHLCPIPPQEFGPMTVPMVSTNSSPPIAMPVQVPHGHVVQQIVDESGTLRHVILSPQHPPPLLPIPQHFGAGNPSGSTQGPQGFYPGALPHSYHQPFTPLQPGVLGHGPPQGHSPPPHNYHGKDERAHRQYNKLKKRLEQKQMRDHPLNTTPPLSPRKEINGNSRKGVGSVGTSEDGEESSSLQDDEDDLSMLTELLGSIKAPQVSEVTSRTALVQWSAPQVENPQDLSYEVLLSDRGKEGKYKSIYTGEALSCRIEDLRPGTEYSVCVSARLENAIGCASEPTQLVTPACRPDAPPAPKLSNRTRNSLTLKWLAAQDNGAHIEHYIVEWDVDGTFQEVAKSKAKQSHIGKLQPASAYIFRVAAVNQYGKSDYSPTVEYQTCDSPPPQPVPPSLVHATPGSLTLQWQSRPQDDDFTLQMEDPDTRHGYLPVYSGKDTLHVCQNLRRNTSYKFRIRSQNDDGPSKWSEEVTYTTLPGRPGPPSRPQLKGKIHLHSFRLRWDPPNDRGGAIINGYTLEIMKYKDCSGAYEVAYHGASPMCTIERLEPGTAYQVRVNCEGPGGLSDYSEPALLATEPVCPGQCSTPRLHGKPKPHSIPIKWSYPDSDGGSPVTEMEVGVKRLEVDDEIITAYKGRETECTVNDLIPAQTYAFMVRASNKVGPGAWSLPLEVTSGSCAPSRPPAPVVGHLPGGVSVAWTPPAANGSPITLYVLQMSTPPCESYSSVYSGSAPHCEVKPVPPATICVFRVQATNSVGSSDWSELGTIVTNPGTPGSVPSLRYTATPTSMTLHWGAPSANGDPVTHYTVEAGDVTTNVPATATTTTLDNLIPNTTYKIRVRGVNSVGPGAASTLRAMTLPLPPTPPQLSCATAGHNYLKLRWGPHNTNPNNYTFTILMTSPTGKRSNVYEGTGTSCKVTRLLEQTSYSFTIIAANRTGKGPESEAYTFTTVIAPPPSVKGLKTTNVTSKSCHVEWAPLRQQGNDSIEYTVQCARLREQTYKQVYQGRETSVEIKELDAGAEYLVKICAVRQSPKGPVEGPYSSPINVSTPPIHHETPPQHFVRPHAHQVGGRRPLTDQQWAGIILSGFIVLAVLFAMLIAHIIY
ncbi:Fibronectin type III domain [Nesidiocoris tenuis]|uniref:Fibronectin type III domain n=1 Tax=Nesidiocoris tenuis TaxID=355587 RepID=A0ABN7A9W3_9HEMI|nr:Fibronectin type III domain [Nesidiocoris tenuis]